MWLACTPLFACGPEATPDPTDARAVRAHKSDSIRVTRPLLSDAVQSPLVVTGEARGTWYFEATFPVRLLDANGVVLVERYAQAEGEWMTEAFVPFRAELRFATFTGLELVVIDDVCVHRVDGVGQCRKSTVHLAAKLHDLRFH